MRAMGGAESRTFRSGQSSSGAAVWNFVMKGLLAILAVVLGVLLVVSARHVKTLPEAFRVRDEPTKEQTPSELASEPAPTFEDTRQRMRAANARLRSLKLELAEARTPNAKRQCGFEAERLGKSAALWCAGMSYDRRLGSER